MQALQRVALLVAGLLFGVVVDVVVYNLIEDMACIPDFPNTCFVTQHAALRPLIHAALILIPLVTCVIFLMLQSNENIKKFAQVSLVILVFAVIALALCAKFIHPQYGVIGNRPNKAKQSLHFVSLGLPNAGAFASPCLRRCGA